jgi:hypothetical protein
MGGLERSRCSHALERTKKFISGHGPEERAEYLRAAKDLPNLLRINGLQAVMLAKRGLQDLQMELEDWIASEESPISLGEERPANSLRERLAGADRVSYRLVSGEAIAYATWLKRWAEALIEKGGGQ